MSNFVIDYMALGFLMAFCLRQGRCGKRPSTKISEELNAWQIHPIFAKHWQKPETALRALPDIGKPNP